MTAIQSRHTLLLGEELPPNPEPLILPLIATHPATVAPTDTTDPPIVMWETTPTPLAQSQMTDTTTPHTIPTNPAPIKDVDDAWHTPPPPISYNRPVRTSYTFSPPSRPITRSQDQQLRARTAHMINRIIATEYKSPITNLPKQIPTTTGYAFAAQHLTNDILTAHQFSDAIIDKDTGDILEYLHLIK